MVFDRFLSEISSASFYVIVYFLVAIGEHNKDTHECLLIKFRSNPFPLAIVHGF